MNIGISRLLPWVAPLAVVLALGGGQARAEQYQIVPSCNAQSLAGNVNNSAQGFMDEAGNVCGSVTTTPSASATTDSSSTITTGGTFQQIAAAATGRKSLEFTNVCSVAANCTATSNSCWLFFGAFASATKANSIQVVAGDAYLRSTGAIPSDAIAATCDGNGDHYRLAVQ